MVKFREMAHGLTHLFYPRLCEGCSKPLAGGEDVLCMGCALELPATGYHLVADNETAMRFAGRLPYVKATTYAYFTPDGLLQHLLHGLKYGKKKETGNYLGRQLGMELKECGWTEGVDIIVPVPLHPKKEALRGYNQSRLIAEGISEVTNVPVSEKILTRVKHTESQTQKTRAERTENMRDAFKVAHPQLLEGKHVLIIDDVLTTSATIEACALALLAVKDVRISIATIGIAS
jgi:ComF family protein